MAWTTPRTWVANELVTAAQMNAHVRDNLAAINSVPACRVTNSASENFLNGVTGAVLFDTERYDSDTIHDNATNNSRLTCNTAGKYLIFACVSWAGVAGGVRQTSIRLGGATVIAFDMRDGSANGNIVTLSTIYQLAATNYVELIGFQNSGSTVAVTQAGNYSPDFGMQRLSD